MPNQSTCISPDGCPSQYFIDFSYGYGRCIKCQAPCLTCNSSTNCLSCLSGILYKGQCKLSCPISFFEYKSTNLTQLV